MSQHCELVLLETIVIVAIIDGGVVGRPLPSSPKEGAHFTTCTFFNLHE